MHKKKGEGGSSKQIPSTSSSRQQDTLYLLLLLHARERDGPMQCYTHASTTSKRIRSHTASNNESRFTLFTSWSVGRFVGRYLDHVVVGAQI